MGRAQSQALFKSHIHMLAVAIDTMPIIGSRAAQAGTSKIANSLASAREVQTGFVNDCFPLSLGPLRGPLAWWCCAFGG
ncbi:MAG TPA: hypothetical protein VF458_14025, partial [Ktedonobacteraceae bacterium]